MAYLHPGVYIEEIPSGSKPIEGVGTSTAAFVGYSTRGPIGEPKLIFKWDDYDSEFGGVQNLQKDSQGDAMGLSVAGFFQNGGGKAYIVRITEDWENEDSDPAIEHAEKAVAYVDNPTDSANKALKFSAVNEGVWANGIIARIEVSALASNLYDVEVGRNNDKGEFSALESFTSVSLDDTDPMFIKNVIDGVSDLVTVDLVDDLSTIDVDSDSYIGTSISGDLNAVSLDFTSLTANNRKLKLAIDGGSEKTVTLEAIDYSDLSTLAAGIQTLVRAHAADAADLAYNEFTCAVSNNSLTLTSGSRKVSSAVVVNGSFGIAPTLQLGTYYVGSSTSGDLTTLTLPLALSDAVAFPDADSRTLSGSVDGTAFTPLALPAADLADLDAIATALSGIAGLGCVAVGSQLVLTSDASTETSAVTITSDFGIAPILLLGVAPTDHGGTEQSGLEFFTTRGSAAFNGQQSAGNSMPQDTLDGGADGGKPGVQDYNKIFTQFIKIRDINIMCLPGQYWSSDSSGNPVIQNAIGHAEKMKSRMVIVDPPPGYELDAEKKVVDMELPSQTYCVVYYPWVLAANQFYHAERYPGLPKNVLAPPSGFAAGMWAKTDGRRGVWKAPAGMATGLLGASKLEFVVEDDEQDSLNPLGINCLRSMSGAGKVIWGSRTRATRADPEWRYVPVRRTAIMIEQSIYGGIQWAVFEPNDHRLWSALRANIGNFMNGLFRVGAFQGQKASDAYFVRCGLGDTMTQGEIDAGQVIVVVGFAPLKPAEFVIVRIQQKVNQQ
jgi:phage tail sheath protein FI